MKIGGTFAFWVKVGLIFGVVAVVLYLYNKAKGLLPSTQTITEALHAVIPSLDLPEATPKQVEAATAIARWRALPFGLGAVAGWVAERYYSEEIKFETLPANSSMDVGASMPRYEISQDTTILNTEQEEYGYPLSQD